MDLSHICMEKFPVRFQHFLNLESVLYVKSKRFIPYAQCKQVYVCSLFVGKPGYLGGIFAREFELGTLTFRFSQSAESCKNTRALLSLKEKPTDRQTGNTAFEPILRLYPALISEKALKITKSFLAVLSKRFKMSVR